MMLQVKNWSKFSILSCPFSILLALLLLFAGCKEEENPFVDPGKTEDPNWVVSAGDMTASMTAVVKVAFTDQAGTLAAFIGDDCCGIAGYNTETGLYWLYISPANEDGGDVQLRFYSPELKRIFDASSTFPFRNDAHLGSVSQPYTPEWTVSE